jgi:hypothetical protein
MSAAARRSAPVLAISLVLVGAVAGCARTVDGQGTPGSSVASSSATSSGDFPSGSATPSAPAPTTAPAASSGAVSTNPDGGVTVTDPAGHFVAVLPGQPRQTSQPGSFGGYSFTVHIAAVQQPYVALVEGEVIQPALPADQIDVALRTAVSTFQSSSGMTLESQTTTTYQGHPARSAVLSRAGTSYQLLVIGYSGNQTYLLFAPKGDKFQQLLSGFHAI